MKALVAMSGGVDSSVSALLVKDMGYDLIGCTMKLYESDDENIKEQRTCCSLDDTMDARSVCTKLGFPYYVFNYKDDFKEKVIDNFIRFYEDGKTPNPCIDCNKYMKFDLLLMKAKILGCNKIVTGHYAKIEKIDDEYYLKKGIDEKKDQSYVLYNLTQENLSNIILPLGSYRKEDIRKIARENNFCNANKKDSQDICFVPNGDYISVIKKYTNKEYAKGEFITKNGEVLGKHNGIIGYTVGQRKRLGVSYKEPLYVCDICKKNNVIVLGTKDDLFKEEFLVNEVNIINKKYLKESFECKVKTRYHKVEKEAKCFVENLFANNGEYIVKVVLKEKQNEITKGQAAVFYDGDIVIGGGRITEILK